jgi:Protein of unknown function (DUF4019)
MFVFCAAFTLAAGQEEQKAACAEASQSWLAYIDKNQYRESWDNSCEIFRLTFPKQDWALLMEKSRKPLGRVIARHLIDHSNSAIDPKGLPAGEYMVMIYSTTFSNKPFAIEVVTLRLGQGQWQVLTYLVK